MLKVVSVSFVFGTAAFLIVETMRWHWGDDSMVTDPYIDVWFFLGQLIGGILVQTIFGLVVGMAFFAMSRTPEKVRRGIITSTITTTIVTSLMVITVHGHRAERTVAESVAFRGAL
ncbi:hypothetical protein [Rhizobium sophoriradicis]|uniref:Uncharacterized protein n=1 Tax=Rhizobium sophoriradicis TaxID=1535245 RepID=A0A2A5KKE3_9HYPH|nr:hypothetical protein [Rhizobium sophoriradicis]PCK77529.1 hypothetical protein CPT34_29485 [Rhizobium sophoriradicis]